MMVVVFLLFLIPLMAVARDEIVEIAGYGEEKLSTVLVTGTLLCQSSNHAWPISGALVDVKCKSGSKRKSGSAEARTNEYGDFMIDLPSQLHGVPNLEKICTLHVFGIPNKSMCRPALVKKHKRMRFSSIGKKHKRMRFSSIGKKQKRMSFSSIGKKHKRLRFSSIGKKQKRMRFSSIGKKQKRLSFSSIGKKHKRLRLSAIRNGIRTYTAGKIRIRHITSKPLKSCITKATTRSAKLKSLTGI